MNDTLLRSQDAQREKLATAIIAAFSGVAAWYFSQWTFEVYWSGDLYHYNNLWRAMTIAGFNDIAYVQRNTTGSSEPLYGIFAWLFSTTGHDTTVSLINAAFLAALVLVLRRHGTPIILLPLLALNFYLLVAIGPAERLKFGLLAVTLALLTSGWKRYVLLAIAPALHLQMLFMALPAISTVVFGHSSEKKAGSVARNALKLSVILGGVAVTTFLLSGAIVTKFTGYAEKATSIPWQSFSALAIALALFRRQNDFIVAIAGTCVAGLILGGSRVNMIAGIFLLAMFVRERRYFHPVFLLILAYLAIKGIFFVQTYEAFGTGWPDSIAEAP